MTERLVLTISDGGYRAAMSNETDDDGFKIKINEAEVFDDTGQSRGTFAVNGRRLGTSQLSLRLRIHDASQSYAVREIRLKDQYSGSVFGTLTREGGGVIDYVNPAKFAVIIANIVIGTLPEGTVTIIDTAESDSLSAQLTAHEESGAAHPFSAITHTPDTLAGYGITDAVSKTDKASVSHYGITRLSSATDSTDEDEAATPKAVKLAFDEAKKAFQAAQNAQETAQNIQSASTLRPGIVRLSNDTDSDSETEAATSKAVKAVAKKADDAAARALPIGAVAAFPSSMTVVEGFLRCDGGTFDGAAYPDLARVLGSNERNNAIILPDLDGADIGVCAWFAADKIPAGWIEFDKIAEKVNRRDFPRLFAHLTKKYGQIDRVPKAQDRYIRNASGSLSVGQLQDDEIKQHGHKLFSHYPASGDWAGLNYRNANISTNNRMSFTWTDDNQSDNGWVEPTSNSPAVTGGSETRPKTLVLKLCIKADNAGVSYWIKAYGAVTVSGSVDVAAALSNMQALEKHIQSAQEGIESVRRENSTAVSELRGMLGKRTWLWSGNAGQGANVDFGEDCTGKQLILYFMVSSSHTLDDSNGVRMLQMAAPYDFVSGKTYETAVFLRDGSLSFVLKLLTARRLNLATTSGWYLKRVEMI